MIYTFQLIWIEMRLDDAIDEALMWHCNESNIQNILQSFQDNWKVTSQQLSWCETCAFKQRASQSCLPSQQHWYNSPVILGSPSGSVSALGWNAASGLLDSRATGQQQMIWTEDWRDGNWRSPRRSNAPFSGRMLAGHPGVAPNFNRHSEWKGERSVSGGYKEPLMSLLHTGTSFLTEGGMRKRGSSGR